MVEKLLLFIPTYNERDNVPLLYTALKQLPISCDILFCDDNSPDGTGVILDSLALEDPHLKVLHRSGKLGLGTAHLLAFNYARAHGYSHLLTMDADFTHDPHYIPALLEQVDKADIVIGSRYMQGGGMKGWGSVRLPFTYFWRGMIKYCLGLPYDATGAFRLYNVSLFDESVCNHLVSKEFSFNIETLYHFVRRGARVVQVPIIAKNRIHGHSKLSVGLMMEEARIFCVLTADRLLRALRLKGA